MSSTDNSNTTLHAHAECQLTVSGGSPGPNVEASASSTTTTGQTHSHTATRALAGVAVTALKLAETTNAVALEALKAMQKAGEQIQEQISRTFDRNENLGVMKVRLRQVEEGLERLMTANGVTQRSIEASKEVLERLMAMIGLPGSVGGDGEESE